MNDYDEWKFYLDLLQFLGTIALGIYVWFSNRQRVTTGRIETLSNETKKELIDHELRIVSLESDMKHMPTNGDIKGLSERMDALNQSLSTAAGRLEGINRAVDLINEHLINGSRGGRQ